MHYIDCANFHRELLRMAGLDPDGAKQAMRLRPKGMTPAQYDEELARRAHRRAEQNEALSRAIRFTHR